MSDEQLTRLERLNKLYQDGALTKEEFEEQKRAALENGLTEPANTEQIDPEVINGLQEAAQNLRFRASAILVIVFFAIVCGLIIMYKPDHNNLSVDPIMSTTDSVSTTADSTIKP